MNKPFKTHRQQIRILRERNLNIADGSKAIRILKKEGYYGIINGYKDIFIDKSLTLQRGFDYYKQGTTLEQIYALYDFDRNLRMILLKYILKMETSLKTKVAYSFSEEFNRNFNYLDMNNFNTTTPQEITKVIAHLSNVITKNAGKKDQGGQFFHYLDKHKELPMWVLVKKMTMGETIHFYNALKVTTKNKIITDVISEYNQTYMATLQLSIVNLNDFFSNMLSFINRFRNICAHEERLYNTLIKNSNKIPNISIFHQQSTHAFSSKLFDCILILGLFISKQDYRKLVCAIKEEIRILNSELPTNLFNQVLINMGFSKTWESDIKLP